MKNLNAYKSLNTILQAYGAERALQDLERQIDSLCARDPQYAKALLEGDKATLKDLRDALGGFSNRLQAIIADILNACEGGESDRALRGLLALFDDLGDYDALSAFECAVKAAQARAGEHPCPEALIRSIGLDQEGLYFSGPAWHFWGKRSEEAMRAARAAFWANILHEAGLGGEPRMPDSIAPSRAEPDGPIVPGLPQALRGMLDDLEYAEGRDEEIGILRAIADAEASGTFAVVGESLWTALSDELRALAGKHGVGVGARLSALIDVALGCVQAWAQADRIREGLIEALFDRCI